MSTRRFGPLAYLAAAVVLIAFVNFFWFVTESVSPGGAAPDWYRVHTISTWVTHPLGILGMFYLVARVLPRIRRERLAETGSGATEPAESAATPAAGGRLGAAMSAMSPVHVLGIVAGLLFVGLGLMIQLLAGGAVSLLIIGFGVYGLVMTVREIVRKPDE
ncbi:MAG TPA: hypothetical protein VFV67_25275 [Actinophytocola sp.]|uniref:hypothetical protein n=1 Tax=Actinophytocola sp. TaxID=1872138 RepID=UPI002DBFC706|nr:hypothetical protein [Actinophytocola sp.]HEU5473972.1 hypothetical protein [Actinophytocola sp.]